MTRNTNSDFGIAIAADRQTMRDGRWQNDTRKKKWTVDVEHDPPHLQIIGDPDKGEVFDGGTKFTLDKGSSVYLEETLFTIKHGMPFPPAFLCYFYTRDAPSGLSAIIGQYQQNRATMLTNAVGVGQEGLFAGVNDTHFYIKHFVETFGLGSGNHTFYGSDFKFRVRFELLNQRAYYTGSKGY